MIINLASKAKFKEHVGTSAIALIDFWAEWCGPCRTMLKVIDDIDAEYGDNLKIYKVNIDECPDLAAEHEIMSIPTLILAIGGKIIDRKVGGMDKATLIDWVKSYTKL